VALLLPDPRDRRHGVLRAVLRDSDDDGTSIWLDSDGCVGGDDTDASGSSNHRGDHACGTPATPAENPSGVLQLWDGEWHHAVLSTLPQRSALQPSGVTLVDNGSIDGAADGVARGFRLYVDGLLRAQVAASISTIGTGTSGSSKGTRQPNRQGESSKATHPAGAHEVAAAADHLVPGGDAASLDGALTLCARHDHDPLTHASGQLAALQLFGEALDEAAVAALYLEHQAAALLRPQGGWRRPTTSPTSSSSSSNNSGGDGSGSGMALRRGSARGARCLLPVSVSGELRYDCVISPGGGDVALLGPGCPTGPRGNWEACADLVLGAGDAPGSSSSSSSSSSYGSGSTTMLLHLNVDARAAAAGAGTLIAAGALAPAAATAAAVPPQSLPSAAAPSSPPAGPALQTFSAPTLSPAARRRLSVIPGAALYSWGDLPPRFTLSGQACLAQAYVLRGMMTVNAGQCGAVGGREVCPVPRVQGSGFSSSGNDGSRGSGDSRDRGGQGGPGRPGGAGGATAGGGQATHNSTHQAVFDLLQCMPLVSVPPEVTQCGRAAAAAAAATTTAAPARHSSSSHPDSTQAGGDGAAILHSCVVQGGLEMCRLASPPPAAGAPAVWVLCPAGECVSRCVTVSVSQ
jgi:hypothetical protein